MKIVENTLSADLFNSVVDEFNSKIDKPTWVSSSIIWEHHLKQGIIGSCLYAPISEEIASKIIEEIKPHTPKCNSYGIQYCMWQNNSGLAGHSDSDYIFGATIYLNEIWYFNAGGLFVWIDNKTNKPNVILPEQNTMVVVDDHEDHLVTQLSSDLPEFRYTIQIFGK